MRAALFALVLAAPAARADDDWYAKAVQGVELTIDPPRAKPGQVVTLKLTVKLSDGYHTYPTRQKEKAAAGMVNKLTFPDDVPGLLVVGDTKDPDKADVKMEPDLGILELRTYHGTLTYERPAVLLPTAAAGDRTVTVKAFRLNVCDANNCFPPKTLTPSATLTVQPGPAVEVPKEYAEAVRKALAGK